MGASGSAQRVKIFQHKKKKSFIQSVTWPFLRLFGLTILLHKLSLLKYFHEIFGLARPVVVNSLAGCCI
jgi:hypothetical protein